MKNSKDITILLQGVINVINKQTDGYLGGEQTYGLAHPPSTQAAT